MSRIGMINILWFCAVVIGFTTNIKTTKAPVLYGVSKNPQTLLFSGDHVCDKYSTLLQSNNNTDDFPIDFNMYIQDSTPADNYTVDVYFKNPNNNNVFEFFNVTDKSDLEQFNPILVSMQEFGMEFKLNMKKGSLCQFLYKFTVAYELVRNSTTNSSTGVYSSDKIFLVGSCELNQKFYPQEHNDLIDKGFRCVEYNSGFKFDGGQDWCNVQYQTNNCCDTYRNDVLQDRQCPSSTLYSVTTPIIPQQSETEIETFQSNEATSSSIASDPIVSDPIATGPIATGPL